MGSRYPMSRSTMHHIGKCKKRYIDPPPPGGQIDAEIPDGGQIYAEIPDGDQIDAAEIPHVDQIDAEIQGTDSKTWLSRARRWWNGPSQ